MCGWGHEYLAIRLDGSILEKIKYVGGGLRVMLDTNCPECTRLRDRFAAATMRHLKARSHLDIARYSHDSAAVEVLTRQVEQSATLKLEAQRALRHHQQQAHTNPPEATSDSAATC
jgi:hypothetical protein